MSWKALLLLLLFTVLWHGTPARKSLMCTCQAHVILLSHGWNEVAVMVRYPHNVVYTRSVPVKWCYTAQANWRTDARWSQMQNLDLKACQASHDKAVVEAVLTSLLVERRTLCHWWASDLISSSTLPTSSRATAEGFWELPPVVATSKLPPTYTQNNSVLLPLSAYAHDTELSSWR